MFSLRGRPRELGTYTAAEFARIAEGTKQRNNEAGPNDSNANMIRNDVH